MATAARRTVARVHEVLPKGLIDPAADIRPGSYVDARPHAGRLTESEVTPLVPGPAMDGEI